MHAAPDAPVVDRRRSTAPSIEKALATVLAALMTVPSPLSVNLSAGAILALALTPVTVPTLWRDPRGRRLMIATLLLVPVGWFTAQSALLEDNGRTFNTQVFLYQAAVPVGIFAALVGAAWCLKEIGLERFLWLSFAGLLATTPLTYAPENPWKYGFAFPVSILCLLLFGVNRLSLGLLAIPLLAAVSIAADFRSWLVILGITAALVITPVNRTTGPSKSSLPALVTAMFGVIAGAFVLQLSSSGFLGGELAKRTRQQLENAGGNVLLGGRPEWGAGFALWRENPLGFGVGVTPSSTDYWLAIRNMPVGSRGSQESSVVADALQQGLFNLHSTFLTFWCIYGVAGVLFSVVALHSLVRATNLVMSLKLPRLNVQSAVICLMLASIWDILFSPTVAAQLGVALAVASQIPNNPNFAKDSEKGFRP